MEMKQINKVSIALKPNVYSTFRNLNNTVSNTLGEYVDNAVQSFLNHKTELFDFKDTCILYGCFFAVKISGKEVTLYEVCN